MPNLFVAYHRPAWGAGIKADAVEIQRDWCPLIERHRATADGPVPLHQARYRPPLPTAAPGSLHGFTGLQRVYEPSLGAELQYWCRWSE